MIRQLIVVSSMVLAATALAGPAMAKESFASCNEKTLEQGDKGDCVKLVQRRLNTWCKAGTDLDIDGVFGPRTKAAVRQFQKSPAGEPPEGTEAEPDDSGTVGEMTWQELESATGTKKFINCISNGDDLPKPRHKEAEPAPASVSENGVVVVFQKNHADQANGTLSIYKNGQLYKDGQRTATWRAGSGHVKDDCRTMRGWLPNGTYPMTWHQNYNGSFVKGYAVNLGSKRCANGSTVRTELFIHTAANWADSQYNSAGCVKLEPADIKEFYGTWVKLGKPKTKLLVK